MKRLVVLSDLHCGHRVGLTPPSVSQKDEWEMARRSLWKEYAKAIDRLKPIDICVINGDAVDGKGVKSGGTELITTDRNMQVDMAVEAIQYIEAKKYAIIFGTPYHVGNLEDWEKQVGDKIGAEFCKGQEWIDVNGTIFDFKHVIGSTSLPYSKGTQISKENLWNLLWSEQEQQQPRADVIVRSHVHDFFYCGENHWLGIITPALQGLGSKFGSRKVSKRVDWGFIWFDVEDDGSYTWGRHIAIVRCQKARPVKL